MSINVGTAVAFLEMDMSGFKSSLKSAGSDLKEFATGGGIQNLSSAMNSVGSELTKKVTLPIVGVGTAAVKMSMDFEAQMSKVKAISGATGEEFDKLRDQAIQLGADTNFSASEAAEGMENLASAGFKTNEIMAAMPGMLDLAAAGDVNIATASDIASAALRGFGMEAKDVTHVADVLAKNAGDTNAAIIDTGEAMKYIAPVAHALGVSFEDTTAAIGLLANAGIKGSQAGTTLRGALTNLAKPTDKAAGLMDDLGMKFFDAHGKMLPLTQIISILKDKTKDLTEQQKAAAFATIFGKEAMSGMLALVDQGPEKFDELSQGLKKCDGASKQMASTMQDNLKGSIEAMKGSIETAAIKFGDALAPTIKKVANYIADLVNKFSALPKSTQENIAKFALLAAAIGPVLMILAKIISSVKTVISVFTGLGKAISGITKVVSGVTKVASGVSKAVSIFGKLGSAIRKVGTIAKALPALLSGPIGWAVLIIAGLGVVVYEVIKHWDFFKKYFDAALKFLKDILKGFWDFICWVFDGICSAISGIADTIGSIFSKIGSFISKSVEGWKMIFHDFFGFMKDIGSSIWEGLIDGLEAGKDWVMNKISYIANGIKSTFKATLGINSPSKVFKGYGVNIGEGLVEGIDSHDGAITDKFTGLGNKIKALGNVTPEFTGLSKTALSGVYPGVTSNLANSNLKQLNVNPNIQMHIQVADTGAKGTAQLTSEIKTMAQTALKNSMVTEFLSDALRL